MFAFLIFRFRFKKFMVLLVFLQMFDMCWFHFISDVVLMYKIVNGLVKIDATDRLVQPSRLSRNMGQRSFQIPSCNTIISKETDEVLWYLFTTYLAALRWTISIRCLSSLRYGSQVVHAYSNVNLTNDM
jgi:hypothetical protein